MTSNERTFEIKLIKKSKQSYIKVIIHTYEYCLYFAYPTKYIIAHRPEIIGHQPLIIGRNHLL